MVLEKEGSFSKDRLEAFGVDWDTDGIDLDLNMLERDDQLITSSGQRMANSIRVVTESMLEFHFGKGVMADVFHKYAQLVSKYLSNRTTIPKFRVFVISLVKKN